MLGRPQGTHCKSRCGLTPWYLKHENYYYYYMYYACIPIHVCIRTICMHVCIHVCMYVIFKLEFERYGGIVIGWIIRGNCSEEEMSVPQWFHALHLPWFFQPFFKTKCYCEFWTICRLFIQFSLLFLFIITSGQHTVAECGFLLLSLRTHTWDRQTDRQDRQIDGRTDTQTYTSESRDGHIYRVAQKTRTSHIWTWHLI